MCLKNGITIFIEVKRPGEKPRPLQVFRMDEIRSFNMPVYLSDGTNIEEIIETYKTKINQLK